jgi:hypothetical protein
VLTSTNDKDLSVLALLEITLLEITLLGLLDHFGNTIDRNIDNRGYSKQTNTDTRATLINDENGHIH